MVILITDVLIVAAIDVAVHLDNPTVVNVTSCESRFYTASLVCAISLSYFGTIPICVLQEKYDYTNIYITRKIDIYT